MLHDSRTVRRSGRHACRRQYARLSPCRAVTDPAEMLPARRNLRFNNGRDAVAQTKIRRSDNAGCGAQIAVTPARAFRRDALHNLKELDRAGDAQADEVHRAEERVQKLTDEHVKRIDEVLKGKEAEILEV